jgi:hypothetical protein
MGMARVAKVFRSFASHDRETQRFYRSLTSAESLKIWLELCRFDKNDAPRKRLKRVFRIVPQKKL